LNLSIIDVNAKKSTCLLELFWTNLEVIVSVLILEEALGIKSFSDDEYFEFILEVSNSFVIIVVWFLFTVE